MQHMGSLEKLRVWIKRRPVVGDDRFGDLMNFRSEGGFSNHVIHDSRISSLDDGFERSDIGIRVVLLPGGRIWRNVSLPHFRALSPTSLQARAFRDRGSFEYIQPIR